MIPAVTLDTPAAPFPVPPLGASRNDLPALDITIPPARKRRPFRRADMKGIVFVRSHDADEQAVKVNLFGNYGTGQWMILHREDWEDVSASFTRKWVVLGGKHRTRYYICTGVRAVARVARQRAAVPCVNLARIIAGAGPREIVTYANGDWRDLRRANLIVEPKARRRAKPAGAARAG